MGGLRYVPIRNERKVRRVMGWEERRHDKSPGRGSCTADDMFSVPLQDIAHA